VHFPVPSWVYNNHPKRTSWRVFLAHERHDSTHPPIVVKRTATTPIQTTELSPATPIQNTKLPQTASNLHSGNDLERTMNKDESGETAFTTPIATPTRATTEMDTKDVVMSCPRCLGCIEFKNFFNSKEFQPTIECPSCHVSVVKPAYFHFPIQQAKRWYIQYSPATQKT